MKEIFWEYNFVEFPQNEMFWEYNFVKLPQRESVGIQLRKVAPKECRVRMQFQRIASKRMLLDATSSECSRKKYFDDIGSGSQFWFWFFDLGSDLIFDSGSIFYFLFFWVWMMTRGQFLIFDSSRIFILLMMTQGQDSFTFVFQWMTLGQEFHLLFLYNLRSRFNLWLVTWG